MSAFALSSYVAYSSKESHRTKAMRRQKLAPRSNERKLVKNSVVLPRSVLLIFYGGNHLGK